ncbi:peroxiredoxin family protein [Bacillota bacterium Lsc_1132]
MWKNIAIIVILMGLLGWGIYNHQAKKQVTEKSLKQTQQSSPANAKTGIEKGNLAPDFRLETADGKTAKLSDYRGKKVILNFWATWCPPCKAEMPHMEQFYKENHTKGIVVLAVNLTTSETDPRNVNKFIADYGLTFPVLLDKKGEVGNLYQAFTIPTSYIIDTKGVIREKIVGPMNKDTMQKLTSNID